MGRKCWHGHQQRISEVSTGNQEIIKSNVHSFVGQLLLSFLFFKVIIVDYHLTPKAKENKI